MAHSRARQTIRLLSFAAAALAVSPLLAGELVLGWPEPADALTDGFEIEVIGPEGALVEVLDVGSATRAVVTGLEDGFVYTFRLRPYDSFGNPAREPAAELVSLPAPRIDRVEGSLEAGGLSRVSLHGANFGQRARVVGRSPGLRVEQTDVVRGDLIVLTLRSDEDRAVEPDDLLVINPVPRAAHFARVHPEILDVDGSGVVDRADRELLADSFGLEEGDALFRPALDLNGDGVIDGEDAALVDEALAAPRGRRGVRP